MAYSALTFTASEIPTLTKWNQMWANDAAMADGTGIANNAILTRHLLANNVTGDKLATSAIKLGVTNVIDTVSHTTTETTVASVTVTVPAGGRDVLIKCIVPQLQSNAADRIQVKIKESSTILELFYHGVTNPGAGEVFETTISAPSAGSHTYYITGTRDIGTGTCTWYADNLGATLKLVALLI